jgi:hypothetical protein
VKTGTPVTSRLAPAQDAFIQLLRQINYGRVEYLVVSAGEPVMSPPPRVIRTVRFGASEDTGTTPSVEELAQRPAVRKLMSLLSRIQNGCIARLEIRNSQPAFMELVTGTRDEAAND